MAVWFDGNIDVYVFKVKDNGFQIIVISPDFNFIQQENPVDSASLAVYHFLDCLDQVIDVFINWFVFFIKFKTIFCNVIVM